MEKKVKDRLGYKRRLEWAFYVSKRCIIGDQNAIERLPKTFGILDNTRRLRNLIIHNHGIFNDIYRRDSINVKEIEKVVHPQYQVYNKSNKPIPAIITHKDIIDFSRAHIEVLHVLHNQIQKEYYGHLEPYSYRKEKKPIEWNKVLWGNSNTRALV